MAYANPGSALEVRGIALDAQVSFFPVGKLIDLSLSLLRCPHGTEQCPDGGKFQVAGLVVNCILKQDSSQK
jgi:hypothetical protein